MSKLLKAAKRLDKVSEAESGEKQKSPTKNRLLRKAKGLTPKPDLKSVDTEFAESPVKVDRDYGLFPSQNILNLEIGKEIRNFLQWLMVQNPLSLEEFSAEELTEFYLKTVEMPPSIKISWVEAPDLTIATLYEHFVKAAENPAEYQEPGHYIPIVNLKAKFVPTNVKARKNVKPISDKQLKVLKRNNFDTKYDILLERLNSSEASPLIDFIFKNTGFIQKGDSK